MLIRMSGGWLTLEAITPDRVEVRATSNLLPVNGGTGYGYALTGDDLYSLERFVSLLFAWRSRIKLGVGPPLGFDRDLTIADIPPEGT